EWPQREAFNTSMGDLGSSLGTGMHLLWRLKGETHGRKRVERPTDNDMAKYDRKDRSTHWSYRFVG
ncbi:MAG: hypothetical protein QGI73_00770, partial [Candidatus Thalassarchaeaceae archaeon]|nr:hypothetical protein [Candidatus Thalassarchaeaceae archaeon]